MLDRLGCLGQPSHYGRKLSKVVSEERGHRKTTFKMSSPLCCGSLLETVLEVIYTLKYESQWREQRLGLQSHFTAYLDFRRCKMEAVLQ